MTKENHEYQPIEESADVPAFSSEEEEAQFWAEHELGDGMLSRMQAPPEGLLPTPRPRSKPISLRVEPDVLAAVKGVAHKRGMPYQTLLKQFVVKQLALEEDNAAAISPAAGHGGERTGRSVRADFPRLKDTRAVCRRTAAIRQRGSVLAYSP
jgi:predicted DNA binding CopG/RHH family protein